MDFSALPPDLAERLAPSLRAPGAFAVAADSGALLAPADGPALGSEARRALVAFGRERGAGAALIDLKLSGDGGPATPAACRLIEAGDQRIVVIVPIDGGARPAPAPANDPGAVAATETAMIRILWRSDEAGVIVQAGDKLRRIMGDRSGAIAGRKWEDLVDDVFLDSTGALSRALARRATASGVELLWSSDDAPGPVVAIWSGVPVFDSGRMFRGFRGFLLAPDLAPPAEPTAQVAAEIAPETEAQAADNDLTGGETAAVAEAIWAEPPPAAISDATALAQDSAALPAPEAEPVLPAMPHLSATERNAFREIAKALGVRRAESALGAEPAAPKPQLRLVVAEPPSPAEAVTESSAGKDIPAADVGTTSLQDEPARTLDSPTSSETLAAETPAVTLVAPIDEALAYEIVEPLDEAAPDTQRASELNSEDATETASRLSEERPLSGSGQGESAAILAPNESADEFVAEIDHAVPSVAPSHAEPIDKGASEAGPQGRAAQETPDDVAAPANVAKEDASATSDAASEAPAPDELNGVFANAIDDSSSRDVATDSAIDELLGEAEALTAANDAAADDGDPPAEHAASRNAPAPVANDLDAIHARVAALAAAMKKELDSAPPFAPAPQAVSALAETAFSAAQADPAQAHARDILDRIPVGVLVNRGAKLLFVNKTLLDLLDYPSAETIEAHGGVTGLFKGRAPLTDRDGPTGPVLLAARDGESIAVDARLQGFAWDGAPATLVTFRRALDVEVGQRLKATELDLRAREAELREARAMLDTATDGVAVIDEDGRIMTLNRAAESLFGYDLNEVAGESFSTLFAPESHALAADYFEGLKSGGVRSVLNDGRELVGRVRQGGRLPLFVTLGQISDKPTRKFCAVLRDLTSWKKTERDLVEARRSAEDASAQKSDFLAKISHEIRTPLNAIIGFAEVMMEERFGPVGNDRYKDYLRDIHASGGHVISLVNDLLDLAKIEAGKLDLSFTSVNANEIVRGAVSLMQPQSQRARVVLRSALMAKLPSVVADERALRQIVINVLSNAVKFTDSGGQVIVSTTLTDLGEVAIRVRDTGIGMTEKELSEAMEPFRQLATSRRAGGTGLGLPLTRALVEANRASLKLSSVKNEGTLVEVVFPPTRVLAE